MRWIEVNFGLRDLISVTLEIKTEDHWVIEHHVFIRESTCEWGYDKISLYRRNYTKPTRDILFGKTK